MKDRNYIIFLAVLVSLTTLLTALIASNYFEGQKVSDEDFEALQEGYDTLHEEHEVLEDKYEELEEEKELIQEGYVELQEDYSRKTEQIEYLEYRIMSDDEISDELKQEIKENVPEEDK